MFINFDNIFLKFVNIFINFDHIFLKFDFSCIFLSKYMLTTTPVQPFSGGQRSVGNIYVFITFDHTFLNFSSNVTHSSEYILPFSGRQSSVGNILYTCLSTLMLYFSNLTFPHIFLSNFIFSSDYMLTPNLQVNIF